MKWQALFSRKLFLEGIGFKNIQLEKNAILNAKLFEKHASKKLQKNVFNFFAGGAGEELTLIDNMEVFNRLKLMPRVLKDVHSRSLSTRLLGKELSLPLLIAPMAFQKLVHVQGEIATAKAAKRQGVIMTVSTLSTSSLKDIKDVSSLAPWLQVYLYKNREITKNLIKQADSLGYEAIVLTVDTPFYAKRLRESQTPLPLPSPIQVCALIEAGLKLDRISPAALPHYLSSLISPRICWRDIEWLRSITALPILLKGILHPKDVALAIEHHIEGIILSNHGGRQLDTAITSLESLQLIEKKVRDRTEIIIDGGIRKGVDILKALALGAKAVMVGRPIIWGLAVNGEEGAFSVLQLLKEEFDVAMALSGFTSIDQINEEILHK